MCGLMHELHNSMHLVMNIDCLAEVNTGVIIFYVVSWLPNFVPNRWNKKELTSKRDNGYYLKFKDLIGFVVEISDEMSDPLCGDTARADCSHQYKHLITLDKESPPEQLGGPYNHCTKSDHCVKFPTDDTDSHKLAINSSTQESLFVYPPCKMCRQAHSTTFCAAFKALKVPERLTFVKTHNLCCSCLRDNHSVADCTSNNRCFVCQKKTFCFLAY